MHQGARYGALALVSKDGVLRLSVAGTLDKLCSDLVCDMLAKALIDIDQLACVYSMLL